MLNPVDCLLHQFPMGRKKCLCACGDLRIAPLSACSIWPAMPLTFGLSRPRHLEPRVPWTLGRCVVSVLTPHTIHQPPASTHSPLFQKWGYVRTPGCAEGTSLAYSSCSLAVVVSCLVSWKYGPSLTVTRMAAIPSYGPRHSNRSKADAVPTRMYHCVRSRSRSRCPSPNWHCAPEGAVEMSWGCVRRRELCPFVNLQVFHPR
jgi:hypothetical protein